MIFAQQTGMFPRIAPSQVSAFPMQSTSMPAVYAQQDTPSTGIDINQIMNLMMMMIVIVMMMKMMTKVSENV